MCITYVRACLLLWGCLSLPLMAEVDSSQAFYHCVAALKQQAIDRGLSAPVVNQVLDDVAYVDRVIKLDRGQPEFNESFADYLKRRVTPERVAKGRKLFKQHLSTLTRVTLQTGVPAQYLVAFWGLETNFGSYFGKMPVIDSLTTLACDNRRGPYFTEELLAALQILDSGEISSQQLRGSWAGAFGHMQFMPSVFIRYAQDGDNDGRRDLWGSVDDAMSSAGNFLSGLGWRRGLRWGREVRLPEGFAYQLTGMSKPRPLAFWNELGVRDVNGRPLARVDIDGAIVVPASKQGPAFLVYDNFHTIMGWNRSEFYALSVGHLADRIAGGGRLGQPPPKNILRLPRHTVKLLQQTLFQLGLAVGDIDGILGPATREAVRAYQHKQGMVADGYPNLRVMEALQLDITAKP